MMFKKLPLAASLLVLLATFAFAQNPTASPSPSASPKPGMTKAQSQKVIIATERKLWEGWKNSDIKPFKSYLSNDSIMVGDSGVADKEASLKELGSMQCKVNSYALSDIKVVFLNSDAALMTYKATQDAVCGGQTIPPAVWASSAYVRRGGKWWAASHQETPAK